jgi:hypothetical protein
VAFLNELDDFVCARVHVDTDGVAAVLNRLDLFTQKFAQHDDTAAGFT